MSDKPKAARKRAVKIDHPLRRYVGVQLDPHIYVALRDSAITSNRTIAGQLRAILTDVYGGDA